MRLLAAFFAAFFVSSLPVSAQTTLAPEPQIAYAAAPLFSVRKQVDEVQLLMFVTDRGGRPVAHLDATTLRLFDSGLRAEITSIRQHDDLPLSLAILIDNTRSVERAFVQEKRIAAEFLRSIVRPDRDLATAALFDARVRGNLAMSSNPDAILANLSAPHPSAGATSLYDAIITAADRLAAEPGVRRRVLVLLTDGDDNDSAHTVDDAIAAAQRADTMVFTVGIHGHGVRADVDALKRMAEATGGRAFLAKSANEVRESFAVLARELRTQYAVSFRPPAGRVPGQQREVRVVAADKHWRIRARKAYYVPNR